MWDFLKDLHIFVRGVHIARLLLEKITAFYLVTLPSMWKE